MVCCEHVDEFAGQGDAVLFTVVAYFIAQGRIEVMVANLFVEYEEGSAVDGFRGAVSADDGGVDGAMGEADAECGVEGL